MRGPSILTAAAAAVVALGGAAVLGPGTAHGHGSVPETYDVVLAPTSTADLYVPTSFGLLISHDGGARWRWVCEQALGGGGSYRASYAVTRAGTVLVTTFTGLRRSVDGCAWEPTALAGAYASVLTVAANGIVYVGLSGQDAPRIVRSHDDAMTFQDTPALPGDAATVWRSLATGPMKRIYVTSSRRDEAGDESVALYRISDEVDERWETLPTTAFARSPSSTVAVMAVAAEDRDLLFARVSPRPTLDGDALYRSDDGGLHWKQVLSVVGPIAAVVVRHGAGAAPRDHAEVVVGTSRSGIHVSKDGGATFAAVAGALQVECLEERSDGELFVCAGNFAPDRLALGHARGADGWQRMIDFAAIAGPVECAPGTVQRDACQAEQWCGIRAELGVTDDTLCAPRPDAGPPVETEPDAGTSSPRHDGGGCAAAPAAALAPIALVVAALAALRRRGRGRRG